jgi:iron complex outermembrane receptor protein
MPLPDSVDGTLVVGGGVRRIGKTAGDTLNTFYVPSYTLLDAFLRYDLGNYRLQVNATNLGDKKYVAGCNSTSQCYFGQGRSVVATTSVRW